MKLPRERFRSNSELLEIVRAEIARTFVWSKIGMTLAFPLPICPNVVFDDSGLVEW